MISKKVPTRPVVSKKCPGDFLKNTKFLLPVIVPSKHVNIGGPAFPSLSLHPARQILKAPSGEIGWMRLAGDIGRIFIPSDSLPKPVGVTQVGA